jgi:hypothetical protein
MKLSHLHESSSADLSLIVKTMQHLGQADHDISHLLSQDLGNAVQTAIAIYGEEVEARASSYNALDTIMMRMGTDEQRLNGDLVRLRAFGKTGAGSLPQLKPTVAAYEALVRQLEALKAEATAVRTIISALKLILTFARMDADQYPKGSENSLKVAVAKAASKKLGLKV